MKGSTRLLTFFVMLVSAMVVFYSCVFVSPSVAAESPSDAATEEVKIFMTGKFVIEETCEAFIANSGEKYILARDEKFTSALKKTLDFQLKKFVIKGVVVESGHGAQSAAEGQELEKHIKIIDFKEEITEPVPGVEKK